MTPRAENVTDSSFSDHLTSFPFHQQQRTTRRISSTELMAPDCRAHLNLNYDVLDKLQNNLRNNLLSTEPRWESKTPGTNEYSTASTFEQQHITEGLVKLWLLDNILK